MTTGSVSPRVSLVWSLNCVTNWRDVHAVLAQRGADRRGRRRHAARTLQLDLRLDLTCHCFSPSLNLLDLAVFQIDGHGAAEDRQLDLDLADRLEDLLDSPSMPLNVPSMTWTRSPGWSHFGGGATRRRPRRRRPAS